MLTPTPILKEIPGPLEIIILISAVLFFSFIAIIFRKLEARILKLTADLKSQKQESEGDAYVINFMTKELEHLVELNDENEALIKTMKDVIKTQESFIKELTTELEPIETKVYNAVFSLPIHKPKKPISL